MRYAKNPVAQFLAAGLVVLVVVVVGTLQLSRRAAADEALNDARATTELLARSVAQPALPPGLVDVDPGAVDQFDRTVLSRLLVGDVQRIKIWRTDGTIVYSDQTQLIGNRFPLGDEELEILENGGSEAEISDLNEPENRFEDKNSGGLLEVYTRIESPDKQPLLFEAYYSLTDIAERRQQVYDAFQPIALGGLLVLVAVTTPLLWALTRRLERTSRDRTRLLEVAADASENERRRIARDLHDGVVQDLAGTSFALSATMRDPATDSAVAQRLEPMAGSLRSSLRSLRSLLVEIYPPDLDVEGLNAALHDLVAPAASMGVEPVVEVYDVEGASDDSIRLVWRVAQEAVRNSLRHAHAQHLTVQVGRHGDRLTLDVTDDGQGFVTGGQGAAAGNNRANGTVNGSTVNGSTVNGAVDPAGGSGGLGLRSLRDLIAEAGGRLDVRSTPGEGTTVHLEVAR